MASAVENNVPSPTSSSKRIVSNAMVLFFRMFFLTLINLYAVRIVLKGLGEVDYGIYSAVVGFITTSTFVSSVLALSIQRFYSFSIGKGEHDKLRDIFSTSTNIAVALTVVVLLVFEVGGTWIVANHLTIPTGRMAATLQTYQFALFTFVFSLLQIPYTAAIFAHEDMGIYAIISSVECILKLGAAYLMSGSSLDHLPFYSSLLLFVAIAVMCSYVMIGRSRYQECRYNKVRTAGLHKELLSFSSWTFLGTAANVGMMQGNTILLNLFFGPLMNYAFGIALQIYNAFTSLCNCIVLALRPAMIKSYADKNYTFLSKLFYIGNKLLFYTLITIGIPFMLEMDTILSLWLGQVSEATVLFSRLIIIYIICIAMNLPITTIVQATGKLRAYHLPVESVTLLCVPLTLFLFLLRCPAWSVFMSMVGVCLLAHVVRLYCLRRCYGLFSIRQYIVTFCLPAIVITLLAILTMLFLHTYFGHYTLIRLFIVFIASPALLFVLVLLIGISGEERVFIRQYVKYKKSTIWNR